MSDRRDKPTKKSRLVPYLDLLGVPLFAVTMIRVAVYE